jgi:1-acyl-sn-glycerol-3-phosphate acyltransferase
LPPLAFRPSERETCPYYSVLAIKRAKTPTIGASCAIATFMDAYYTYLYPISFSIPATPPHTMATGAVMRTESISKEEGPLMATLKEEPLPRVPTPQITLPPLNAATIQRAREGLAAARDQHARAGIEYSLVQGDAIAEGQPDRRLSGAARRRLLHLLMNSLFKVRVENIENIPTTPVMLAPNHLNHIDPFLVLAQLPAEPYYYVLGDARTLYNKTWKRWLIHQVGGVIPLDRIWKEETAVMNGSKGGEHPELAELAAEIARDVPDGGSLDALRRLDRIVQGIFGRGDAILIFPEGGLGTREGHLRLPLKRGAIIYAMRAGVPIVPVGITGNRDLFLRKEITIRFGKPLEFAQVARPRPREVQTGLVALEQAITDLIDPHYQEPTGPKPLRHLLNHMLW